jgi:hypothetical protein
MDIKGICLAIIVEKEFNTILCRAINVSSGVATCKGLFNTSLQIFPISMSQFKPIAEYDFDSTVYYISGYKDIHKAPDHIITPEYLELKRLTKLRNSYLWAFEQRLQEGLGRAYDYFDDNLEAFLISELNKCKPDEGYYTDAIYEYAAVAGVDINTVYQELYLRSQTNGLIRLRNKAFYDKGVIALNSAKTEEELKYQYGKVLDDAFVVQRI